MNFEEIESLLTEAEAENKIGKFEKAERFCNIALDIISVFSAEETGKSETNPNSEFEEDFMGIASLRARALNGLSESFWRRGMAKEAIPPAEEALHLSIHKDNKAQEARILTNLGNVYWSVSNYSRALEYYSRALPINEEIGDINGIARNTGNIGLVYRNLSDYPRALEYYSKALAIHEEIGDKDGIANNLGNIGLVYYNLSDYSRAMEYYSIALAINEEIGNKDGVARNTGDIGNVYSKISDYPPVLEYYSKALAMYEEIGNKNGVAVITGNIGNVYKYLSDYSRALEYYSRALAMYEEIGNKNGVAIITGNIGAIYGTKEFEGYDAKKAEDYLLKSIVRFEEIGSKEFEPCKSLAELYENEERWKEAHQNLKKYIELKDEVQSTEAKNQAGLMEQSRQTAEKEKEIEIAKAAADAKLNATASLLHRVLPESISNRMIQGEENISDFFPSVSILFADIQGFTAISANMKAIDVVRFLNFVFGEFDRIMKAHGCEKIKTIGDGYMAMAGAPIECEDHAERLAAAALEMQETIHLPEDIRASMPAESRFGIRIGLHTGSVVAGVIGEERFVYDIHSDAVNLASRMESSGEVDRVHVSSDFAEHLRDRFKKTRNTKHGIRFEDRGETNIKGKGMMKTYFIEKQN